MIILNKKASNNLILTIVRILANGVTKAYKGYKAATAGSKAFGKVDDVSSGIFNKITQKAGYDDFGKIAKSEGGLVDFNKVINERTKKTNLDLVLGGRAPIGSDGNPISLHHMTQSQKGALSEVTEKFHKGNHSIIHVNNNTIPSGINRSKFNSQRQRYWKERAEEYLRNNDINN